MRVSRLIGFFRVLQVFSHHRDKASRQPPAVLAIPFVISTFPRCHLDRKGEISNRPGSSPAGKNEISRCRPGPPRADDGYHDVGLRRHRHRHQGEKREALRQETLQLRQAIRVDHLPQYMKDRLSAARCLDDFDGFSLKQAREIIEEELIVRALHETGGNRVQASKQLEISYPSLLAKIKQYGIEPG